MIRIPMSVPAERTLERIVKYIICVSFVTLSLLSQMGSITILFSSPNYRESEGGKPPFHTCSLFTLEAQYHTVRYQYRTVRYQYRTVRYHIPYGISPYFFPWYFSLLFPHSFSCSGSLFLASSLSLGFTHGEVHNNSPPGITIRQSSHFPP